jgi:hypothetical protein
MLASVEAGFDSYIGRYAIAEADTLSQVEEARTRLRLGYASGSLGRDYALVEARQYLGQSSWESALHAMLTRRFGANARVVTNFDAEVSRRGFREGSTYQFPNDYTRLYGRAGLRVRQGSSLTLRLDDRVEHLAYDQRTEFDYDYTRNVATAAVDFETDPFRTITGGVRLTTMTIPDSSEIAYVAPGPFFEVRAFRGLRERAYLAAYADRRLYPDDGTRASFWSLLMSGLLEVPVASHWSIELAADLDHYHYDGTSDVYNDYVEVRAFTTANWFTGETRIGLGPAFGWLSSREAPFDEYRELGIRFATEHIGGSGLYFSAAYEPGLRDYGQYNGNLTLPDQQQAIFSDYVYHRVNLFANVRVYHALWANLFVDYQPEDHDRDGDDATATVISASLSYGF